MYILALHEIGHALGLVPRSGTDWIHSPLDDYWTRPAFVSRFGVTEGVFSFVNSHFNLPGDIMSNDNSVWYSDVTSLSAAVLDDTDFYVDYDAVEEFVVPSAKLSILPEPEHNLLCGVGH